MCVQAKQRLITEIYGNLDKRLKDFEILNYMY